MLLVGNSVSFAMDPYVPIPPSTQGEMSPTVQESSSGQSTLGAEEAQTSSNTIQKTPNSQDIQKGVDKGYAFFERLRIRAIEAVQQQKEKIATAPTAVAENQSIGTNAGNIHNYLLLFILNAALFILTHKVILYILLIIIALGVMRVFI